MNQRDKLTALINRICNQTPPDLSDGDRQLLSCGLDSLDLASVMLAIEDEFDIEFSVNDLERLNSLNGILAFLESNKRA